MSVVYKTGTIVYTGTSNRSPSGVGIVQKFIPSVTGPYGSQYEILGIPPIGSKAKPRVRTVSAWGVMSLKGYHEVVMRELEDVEARIVQAEGLGGKLE